MVNPTLLSTEEKMRTSIGILKKELSTIRTGRATPALVEHLKVEYAGVPVPLNQIAGISAPGANLLVIQPWDRGGLRSIEKAILKAELGLNPTNDGNLIRINIPPLTEERRQELIRVVRRMIEERKIIIRNLRREAVNELKNLEKSKDISQDEHKRALDQLQKLTDSFIADAEQIGRDKEAELLEV
ncbi:MAG TPA: ribosome recycling factor [Dehalococcoidales bacterium]|nr:ribosome recycling factor [Dehalococcoidales bacterium]